MTNDLTRISVNDKAMPGVWRAAVTDTHIYINEKKYTICVAHKDGAVYYEYRHVCHFLDIDERYHDKLDGIWVDIHVLKEFFVSRKQVETIIKSHERSRKVVAFRGKYLCLFMDKREKIGSENSPKPIENSGNKAKKIEKSVGENSPSGDISFFNFKDGEVRVVMKNGVPWFVAPDIAKYLGYKHTPHMIEFLDDDEKDVGIADTNGGKQKVSLINESGFYHAAFKSRKPEAKAFRKHVAEVILPQIRKTGSYNPTGLQDNSIKAMQRKIDEMAKLIQEQSRATPHIDTTIIHHASAYRQLMNCDGVMDMDDAARLLGTSRTPLFKLLRKHNILMCKKPTRNKPYKHYIDAGLFVLRAQPCQFDPLGLYLRTHVTMKGLEWLKYRFFIHQKQLQIIQN